MIFWCINQDTWSKFFKNFSFLCTILYLINVLNKEQAMIKDLFKKISKYDNITKFSVEDPSLNEIFISIVGDSYE